MTERKHQAREALREASNELSVEFAEGKWDHLPGIRTTPVGECMELLKELERRCPGHAAEAYQEAFRRSVFTYR
ncbi:MAG: hypothetical protein E6Q97_03790 [Desulfurellales bacterium]|nr:MAG: hypothetical protein E6Q97_03790 [Desulfurellales bacterium]